MTGLLIVLLALANAAPQPAPVAEAEALISEGNHLRRNGDDLSALPMFDKAYRLAATPRSAAQLGLVEQALGRWADSEAHLAEALIANRDSWVTANRSVLQESLRAVKPHVGSLEILGEPVGTEILLNGRNIGQLPLPRPVRVSGGPVQVEARASGRRPYAQSLDIVPGQFRSIVVRLEPISTPVPQPTPSPVTATGADTHPSPGTPSWPRQTAWAGLGLGTALIATGVVGNIIREGKASDFADAGCTIVNGAVQGGARCPDLRTGYENANRVTWIGYIGGAILVIPSITALVLLPRPSEDAAVARATCGPWAHGFGVGCSGTF